MANDTQTGGAGDGVGRTNTGASGRRPGRKRGRARRMILIGGGALLLVLAVLIALAPTIASSVAPGMVEGSLNPTIQGRVSVGEVRIGWFKTLEAGPVEVFDPKGELAARLEVAAPVTVWKAVSGGWWSAKQLDIGTVDASGLLNLRQYADGSTNLQRAMEPKPGQAKPAQPKKAEGEPAPLPRVQAALNLADFDISIRDEKDNFKQELGLKDLAGRASVDFAPARAGTPGTIKAAADLKGQAIFPDSGASSEPMTLKLDADLAQQTAGGGASGATGGWSPDNLARSDVKLAITNAPVAVADAIGNLGGALVEGLGDRLDVTADIGGKPDDLSATVKVTSAGLNADAALSIKDGAITAASSTGSEAAPAHLALRSTAFLERLPQTRDSVAKAAETVRLTQAPSLEFSLEKLRVPVPKSGGSTGAAPSGGNGLETLDLRGASFLARVRISGVQGQVSLPESGGTAGESPAAPAAAKTWKPFTVEPIELRINVEDLARPVRITTGTKATLDGQPAGELALDIGAEGLLDAAGHLRALKPGAGFADKALATIGLARFSTALLQPVIAGLPIPVDLRSDIGPTLSLNATARSEVGAVGGGAAPATGSTPLPPTDLTASIRADNLSADVEARVDKGTLTTSGKHIKLTMNSAAPLAQRILAAGATAEKPATISIAPGSQGKVEVTIKDVSVPLPKGNEKLDPTKVRATAALAVSDLAVIPQLPEPEGVTNPQPAGPVRVDMLAVTATLAPGASPKVAINSGLAHTGNIQGDAGGTFAIEGEIRLDGLAKGMPDATGPALLAAANPNGQVAVRNLPRSLLWVVPALREQFSPAGAKATSSDLSRAIAQAAREALGPTMNLTTRFLPAGAEKGGGQFVTLKFETAGKGVGLETWARVSGTEAELTSTAMFVSVDPRTADPVLAALAAKPAADGAAAPAPSSPMKLGAPFKLHLTLDKPAKMPFKTGADAGAEIDWSRAGDAAFKLAVEGDAVVENVVIQPATPATADGSAPATPARTATLALRALKGGATLPLSGLDPAQAAAKRAAFSLEAAAVDRTAGNTPIGSIAAQASATLEGKQPEADVRLTDMRFGPIEGLIGQPGLLVGALGESGNIALKARPVAPGSVPGTSGDTFTADLQIQTPRITGGDIGLAIDDSHIVNTKPWKITWTPDAAFLNSMLFPPAAAAGPASTTPAPKPSSGPNLPDAINKLNPFKPDAAAEASKPKPVEGSVKLTQASPISITVDKASVSLSKSEPGSTPTGPMKPGVFALAASIRTSAIGLSVPTESGETPMTMEGIAMSVRSLEAPAPKADGTARAAPIQADLEIDRITGAPAQSPAGPAAAPAPAKAGTANIKIARLADASGVIDVKAAVINADVQFTSFPTAIADSLANQKGLLTELLGQTITLTLAARNASQSATAARGSLDVQTTSPRATAKLQGDLRKGRFVQTGPVDVRLTEIRPQLVDRLAGSLPVIQSLEKSAADRAAMVDAEGLTIPIASNDMRELNGKITVDLGVTRFTTNNLMGKLLKSLGGQNAGVVGRRIAPFVVNINQGVAQYEQFRLPFGEFDLETRGEVNLVDRTINVVTYAPFFALSEEALGSLKLGIGGKIDLIDRATMVPITTKGPLDNPKTELDVGLFLKELGDKILKTPGDILKQPGKILDDLFNKDKDKKN